MSDPGAVLYSFKFREWYFWNSNQKLQHKHHFILIEQHVLNTDALKQLTLAATDV